MALLGSGGAGQPRRAVAAVSARRLQQEGKLVMKAQRGAGSGPADNERVLRYLAKITINPAITHGLAADVGSLRPGRS